MDPQKVGAITRHISKSENASSNPFYICDLRKVDEVYAQWVSQLSGIQPYYAVKTNPDDVLLRHLAALGCNFDCASQKEMQQVLDIGVLPTRIIFAHPIKCLDALRFAKRKGVDLMTFDNVSELVKLKQYYPEARLVLRIKAEIHCAIINLNEKFGVGMKDVNSVLDVVKRLNLNCVGITFHVGSGTYQSKPYQAAIQAAKEVFEISASKGLELDILDIGGGFTPESFVEVSRATKQCLNQYFPPGTIARVISEPGRLLCQDAFSLICNVIGINHSSDESQTVHLYQSDGVWQSFADAVYAKIIFHPSYLIRYHEGHQDIVSLGPGSYRYVIWGPSCDSFDCVARDFSCNMQIEMGDWLVYEKMGAYTLSCTSDFNGIDRPRVVTYLQ